MLVCRIKDEFVRKPIFLSCYWLFEFESCVHIERTFFSIASSSTNKSSQCFGLIGWWRSYVNVFLVCLAVFVQPNIYIPFCTIGADWFAIKLGLWNNVRWKAVDSNHHWKPKLCFICLDLCSDLIRLPLMRTNELNLWKINRRKQLTIHIPYRVRGTFPKKCHFRNSLKQPNILNFWKTSSKAYNTEVFEAST